MTISLTVHRSQRPPRQLNSVWSHFEFETTEFGVESFRLGEVSIEMETAIFVWSRRRARLHAPLVKTSCSRVTVEVVLTLTCGFRVCPSATPWMGRRSIS